MPSRWRGAGSGPSRWREQCGPKPRGTKPTTFGELEAHWYGWIIKPGGGRADVAGEIGRS